MGILLTASKMVPNWSPWVDHNIASTMITPVVMRPTRTDLCVGRLRLQPLHHVDGDQGAQLLSAAAMQLIKAAARLAAINPRTPTGIRYAINADSMVL